jgi:hypothetical protein
MSSGGREKEEIVEEEGEKTRDKGKLKLKG